MSHKQDSGLSQFFTGLPAPDPHSEHDLGIGFSRPQSSGGPNRDELMASAAAVVLMFLGGLLLGAAGLACMIRLVLRLFT